jgi:hypothetical protein
VLHWLLPQAFFLVRFGAFDAFDIYGARENDASKSACGLSFTSLVVFYVLALGLVVMVRLVGRSSMTPTIPFAYSCSLFVSVACHPPDDDGDAALAKVKWGVVDHELAEGYAHCSLTSKAVEKPEYGKVYR